MSSEDPGRPIIHPLIHPTQSVSPSALLDSLITVARRVSHHHNTSPIHRLILRNVSRRVSLLLAFLEQISAVHSPALLALSDLFVSLQKLELAMRACARRGATLHTLMRSARVADDLRVSTRAIATALDVLLPSRASALEVHEEEAWELARLVADQSARASFSTDLSDRRVFDDAVTIIGGFERRVLPDEAVVRRVLDRLGIRSWADCDAEVPFLETQIGCAGSGPNCHLECGGLDPIIRSLNDNPTHHAAAIVFYMSSVEEYRKTIGETEGAITGLVELVRRGSLRARRNAIAALFGLIYFDGNRKRVIAAGGVEALIGVLRASDEGEDRIVNDTLAVLVRLAERAEGAEEMRRVASAGAVVVKIMCRASTSRCAKECCVSVLVAMCDNGGAKEVVGELVKMPSLMGALYGILTDGTARASKKARLLLGTLHGFRDRMGSSRETMVAVVRVQ
ncbi:U-box domain-containing protein 19 [Acorus calamus]|uniref:U-box domain-containing protein 19 n=1 Tax=Acorus calamus TaxID=4465 RepID=A0AAV9EDU1_ACOCL|nr:U-box domain-containing protein 19 [Acorus calamus]